MRVGRQYTLEVSEWGCVSPYTHIRDVLEVCVAAHIWETGIGGGGHIKGGVVKLQVYSWRWFEVAHIGDFCISDTLYLYLSIYYKSLYNTDVTI